MRIVYCGFGRVGLECFYQLVNVLNLEMSNIIVFTHDVVENREFITHLKNNRVEYSFDSVNKYHERLTTFNPDLLLSVYYRYIIKSEILKVVNYKAMNLHPSLLPSYRGTKSSVWAIINGEKETGISFHYITEIVDDGEIILQEKIDILDTDTAYSLYNKLISLFILNFPKALIRLINNYEGKAQRGKATYYKRELPFNGEKDFFTTTYEEAKQFVKAMYFPPYKGAFFSAIDNKKVEIRTVQELDAYKHLFRMEK